MRSLTSLEIVRVWEAGVSLHGLDRALLMLQAAEPERDGESLAALSIGARDAQLIALRERMFGRELAMQARCPACGDELELAVTTDELRAGVSTGQAPFSFEYAGVTLVFRLPDSRDLAAAAQADDGASELARRCLVRGEANDANAIEALAQAILDADPQAEVLIDLACPACAHIWQSTLDPGAFVWSELAAEARRLLQQVHVLASAYGWSEEAVLRLGPARRRVYLQMAGA